MMADDQEINAAIAKFAEAQGVSIEEAKIALEFGAVKNTIEGADIKPDLRDALLFLLRKLVQLEHLK